MMKTFITYSLALLVVFFTCSCDSKKNEVSPDGSFIKFYDKAEFEHKFYSMDIIETDDNGYLTLSAYNTFSLKEVHLQKVSNNGELLWETILDATAHSNAAPKILVSGGNHYFFCMHPVTLETQLMQVDHRTGAVTHLYTFVDFQNPLHASAVPGGFILLSFDRVARDSKLAKFDASLNLQWFEEYSNLENPPEFNDHLSKEKPIPFFTGYVGTTSSVSCYYFHGFNNQKLTTTFVNTTDGGVIKDVEGQRYDAGTSGLYHIENNTFAMAKYNIIGETSVLPNQEIDWASGQVLNILNPNDIPDNIAYELPLYSPISIKRIEVKNNSYIAIASETKANQIQINFYEPSTNQIVASKTFGNLNPLSLGAFIISSDGGLVALGNAQVAGRFSRIAIFKISPEELEDLF